MYGKGQMEEIATIKERTITLKLSDADCDRLLKKAGGSGLTVAELLQNFIGDLVDGTYTNGSDERMYAQDWFDRCGFGYGQKTLLGYLLEEGINLSDFVSTYEENEMYKRHPEEFDENEYDMEPGEKFWFQEDLESYLEYWKPDGEPDMEKELAAVRQHIEEVKALKGE